MNVGILGSGFGIYGYLPAICEKNWIPIVLDKVKFKIESRPELQKFKDTIVFVNSEKDLLEMSKRLVIARNPESQALILKSALNYEMVEHLYLEKPITDKFENRQEILKLLESKSFSIAYLVFYTTWYGTLRKLLSKSSGSNFKIRWDIPMVNSKWKSNPDEGGGLLMFYGSHFLAMLFGLGFDKNSVSISQVNSLNIDAFDDARNHLEINLNYSMIPFFSVVNSAKEISSPIYSAETPFGNRSVLGKRDSRISLLSDYLNQPIGDFMDLSKDIELYISDLIQLCIK